LTTSKYDVFVCKDRLSGTEICGKLIKDED
jgi:hypothetical protein